MNKRKKILSGSVLSLLLLGIFTPLFSPSLTIKAQTDGYIEVNVVEDTTSDPIDSAEIYLYDENYTFLEFSFTNVTGFYNFTGLEVGIYYVKSFAHGYEWSTYYYASIDYDGEGVYLEVRLIPIYTPGSGFIDVYVFGLDTLAPIEGAGVWLFNLDSYSIESGYTNVDGFYNFTGLGADTYIVQAGADGYFNNETLITIDYDGEGEYYVFDLEPIYTPGTGFIDVYVYGLDTLAPVENTIVDLHIFDIYWITGGLTNVDGFYNFTGLGAATYSVLAIADGYEREDSYVTIDYDGEGEYLEFYLTPIYTPGDGFIEVHVYDNDTHNPIEGAEVWLFDEYDNFVDMEYTDILGFYNFTGLGVNTYRIEGSATGYLYNETYVVIDYDGEGEYLELYLSPDSLNPFISDALDFDYIVGETGNIISWVATDENPYNYTIYRDSTLIVDSENWSSDTPIIINVDGLAEGSYTFVITVMDLAGNTAQDIVIITVNPIVPEFNSLLNLLFLTMILCFAVVYAARN